MCASVPASKPRIPELEELTLDEKIGQLFATAANATYTGESGRLYRNLMHDVQQKHVGGITWFVSPVYDAAFLTRQLQDAARIPLLVSADLEAGVGMRFLHTTYWPMAMAVAATGDPRWAEEQGRITAREAKVLGINHILAPVADVNSAPDNPVISARSYGEDPQEVSRYVAAFIRGVQSEGLLATVKHFPGHGDTQVDSHRSLPILDVDRARLDAVELVPFRAAIQAGVDTVMIAHLSIPSLDKTIAPIRDEAEAMLENPYGTHASEVPRTATVPASVSQPVILELLRGELGFKGLVVSDALDMGGIVAHYEPGEAAVRAIEAGEDHLLKSPDIGAAIAGVKEAVRSGRLPEARIDESVRRILEVKRRLPFEVGTQEEIFRTIDSEEHRGVAREIARRALTLLRVEEGLLPLRRDQRVVVLTVSDIDEVANPLPDFVREVAVRTGKTPPSFLLDLRSTFDEVTPFLEAARNADVVLVAMGVRQRSGAGRISIPAAARHALDQLPPSARTVVISFGSPYLLRDIPATRNYICAYGVQPVMQVAAVAALYGEAPMTGRLPVTIPGHHQRGEGLQSAPRAAAAATSRR